MIIMIAKSTIKQLVNSQAFIRLTSIMIILCSLVLGVEASFTGEYPVFQILDIFFTAFFVVEIVLRILAEPHPLRFFWIFSLERLSASPSSAMPWRLRVREEGFWNWFDFLITAFSVFSLVVHIFEHPEFLVVGRLFRVLRILRLLEVSDELKEVERKIVSIIPTVFSFALLLGVLLYIYAIVGIYLFSHHRYENADFSSLGSSFMSLFQVMTLEGWVDMMYQASEHYQDSWWIRLYFISFVILTVIISFNVFVAVLTSQVQEKINQRARDQERQLFQETSTTIKDMHQELLQEVLQLRREIRYLKEELHQYRKQ